MTIFMDRLIGLGALLIIVLLLTAASYQFVFSKGSENLKITVAAVGITSLCGILFVTAWLFRKKICSISFITGIINWIEKKSYRLFHAFKSIFDTIDTYKSHWKVCLGLVFISLITHFLLGLSFYLVGLSLNVQAPLILFVLSIQVSNAVSSVLPLPGGLGVRDSIGKAFLLALGCSEAQASAAPLLYTGVILFWAFSGSLFFLYWRTFYKSPVYSTEAV